MKPQLENKGRMIQFPQPQLCPSFVLLCSISGSYWPVISLSWSSWSIGSGTRVEITQGHSPQANSKKLGINAIDIIINLQFISLGSSRTRMYYRLQCSFDGNVWTCGVDAHGETAPTSLLDVYMYVQCTSVQQVSLHSRVTSIKSANHQWLSISE